MRPLYERDWVRQAKRLPGAKSVQRDPRLLAVAHRIGLAAPPAGPPAPPLTPVGVKFELTYACNLRCAFCYTDSPRRTLERSTDLSDDDWDRIGLEAIELGVLEAVVTGGEPLLRAELALRTLARFDAAGVNTDLTTNGWFIDGQVADAVAGLRRCRVNVSLDGATPELHDRARGVPGSWRRAVRAIDLLLTRGVRVNVQHVVTPDNVDSLSALLAQLRTIGVLTMSVEPVVPIGAAARGGDFSVDHARLRQIVEQDAQRGGDLDVRLRPPPGTGAGIQPPAFLLVRPNGAAMPGTAAPFRFGNAREDGLAECWQRMTSDWNHPRVQEWREPLIHGQALSDAPVVMYRDDETTVDEPLLPAPKRTPALPRAAASTQKPGPGNLRAAAAHVRSLALARRYRLGDVRWSAGRDGDRFVRLPSGDVTRLNSTAAAVMDACSPGTAGAALELLAARHPGACAERLGDDAVVTVNRLVRRGVLVAV